MHGCIGVCKVTTLIAVVFWIQTKKLIKNEKLSICCRFESNISKKYNEKIINEK